jgi:hypothetical protein
MHANLTAAENDITILPLDALVNAAVRLLERPRRSA